MKKKYLSMLSIMFAFVVFAFAGCAGGGSNFKFSASVEEIEIILGQTTSSEEVIDDSVIFSVNKQDANADDGVWTSVQNESIVAIKKISENSAVIKFMVTGLMPGSAKISIHNLIDSSDYREIKVNVYQSVESVKFVSENEIYIPFGGKYVIKADSELNLSPIHSAKSDLRFEMVQQFAGVTINETTGLIDATNATVAGKFSIKVYGKNNPDNYDVKVVNIVKPIESESLSLSSESGKNVIQNGEIKLSSLELVKTIENLSYEDLILECSDYSSDLIDLKLISFNNKIIQADVKGGSIIRVQAVALGKTDLVFSVNLKNAEDYLESIKFTISFSVIDIPNAININGKKVDDEIDLTVYDRYNDNVLGASVRFSLSPSSVLLEDSVMKVTYADLNAVGTIRFLNENGELIDVNNGTFEVKSGETLYVRANNAMQATYEFNVESLKAKEYELNLECKLNVKVVTGISSINVPSVIYIEKGESADLELNLVPVNANVEGFELGEVSDKLTLTRQSSTSYTIKANDVTDEILRIYYRNGGGTETRIISYVPLTDFALEVDSPYTNSAIGQKEYYSDGKTLKKIYLQINSEVDLKKIVNENATIIGSEFVVANGSIATCDNWVIRPLREGVTQLVVNLTGYEQGGNGNEIQFTASITIEAYRAISSITLNKLNAIAYDYSTVGFYNKSTLSQIGLVANVYPQNATYAKDVEWTITDRTSNDFVSGSLSAVKGLSTIVTAGPLEGDMDTLIVTATVKEFGRTYSESCMIEVSSAKLVNSIVLTNVVNGNIYFDSRKGLDNESNTFKVEANAYPTDALNTKVRYQYRSTTTGESVDSPVFKVDANGVVTPLRAGKAKLRIASEDSFTNASDATNYVEVFVTVQDGLTRETAFHISTASDLMSIGTDALTMSYYYILTNNIDFSNVSNFEPIGRSKKLAFTGYLSGLFTFEQLVNERVETFSLRSSILNLNINKSIISNDIKENEDEDYFGLFAQISSSENVFGKKVYDTVPRIGTICDLTLQVSVLKVDCSGINVLSNNKDYKVYVGAVAGKFSCDNLYKSDRENAEVAGKFGVINVNVVLGEFKYYVGKNTAYVGGLLGQNSADILYTSKTNAVSGGDIIIVDKIKFQIPGMSAEDTYHSTYYVGGMVGQNDGYIKSIYNEKNGNDVIFSSLFEDEGIDVTANINNEYNGIYYNNAVLSENAIIGGLVGQNNGSIMNVSTDNVVYGLNNVGGLVGINGNDGKIYNAFSSSLVRGTKNIGGLIGMNAGHLENSYVQSYEDGKSFGDDAVNVKGNTNVGGLIGYAVGGSISKVYSATYKDRVVGAGSSVNEYAGDVVGVSNVGGLIGYAYGSASVDMVIRYAYTNFVAIAQGSLSGMIGYARFVNLDNSYMQNKNNATFIVNGNDYLITSSYAKFGENAPIIFDAKGSPTDNFNSFSGSIWNKTGLLPYLEIDGFALVQQPPKSIEIVINAYKVGNESMLLFYYTSNDVNDKLALLSYNIYKISDLISANVLPTSGYVNRLKVTSANEDVVKVLSDGSFNVVGTGSARITVTSKLSAKVFASINIYATYPVLDFDMYQGNNVLSGAEKLTTLRIKKGDNYQIRPYVTAKVNGVSASIATDLYVEYKVECDLGDYTQYFTFESSESAGENAVTIDYYLTHIVNALEGMGGKLARVTARPYIVIESGEKVYLSDYFEDDRFTKQFNIGVILGATDFEFLSEENTTISAGTEIDIKARLHTDDPNDDVLVTILDAQNRLVSSYTGGHLSSAKFDLVSNLSAMDEQNQTKDYNLTLKLNDESKFIKEETRFTIILSAKTEPSVKLTYYLTFMPENIQRTETKVYTYAERDVMGDNGYNPTEEPSSSIIPGYNALLSINVFPIYADFDYIEVTNSEMSFEQLVKNDSKSINSYPYERLADRNYLVNGITLVNAYYRNGQLVRGVNGEYYVSMLVASETTKKSYTVKITAYKETNGEKIEVYSYDLVLDCAYLPKVNLSLNGETSKQNNEIYMPFGTESELGVSFFEYDGDVSFDVTKDGVNYPYASVTKVKGTNAYKLNVSSLASVGDVVEIKATINKRIGKLTKTATDTLEFIVVDYVIKDIGFENVSNNVMREVFGGTYALKLSFEKSKFFYDETNDAIRAKIIADLEKLSTSDFNTWYAYKASNTGNDVAIGKYYKNAYFEVNSKSITSKDLYVTGVNYDNKDSNQKRISAKLKFSFDRVTKEWVYEKSGIENIYRDDKNLSALLTDKYIANGKVYQILDRVFTVNFYLNTDRTNAVPIYNENEFYAMEADISYILMTDLVLDNFKPISTQIKSFNGNNHTITINSYKDETELENRSGSKQIGLFTEIYEGAIFENIHLIVGNSTLEIDAEGYSQVIFGLLTAVNNGSIYNCSVSYAGEEVSSAIVQRVINGKEVISPYDYQNTIISSNLAETTTTVSGNAIPASAKGLKVRITLTTVDSDFVESTMGILVGENNGTIANSRIEENVKFHNYGVVGAITGQNSGVVSSCYSKAILYSYTSASEYSKVGGLVGSNSGRIALSFVEGKYNFANRDNVEIELNAVSRVGGFVYENAGEISNCYSNIRINSNAPTAGFVFTNSGSIKNTYSTSIVRENSVQDMPYIGLDDYNNVNNTGDIISAYFLMGKYTYQDSQPATMIETAEEFAFIDTFESFAFDTEVNGNVNENSVNGVWFIPTTKASTTSAYKGQKFIYGKPTITSANIISRGYVDLVTVTTTGGQPEYIYTSLIGANYGSVEHPYVIYSASDFNTYVLEPASSSGNDKYYIMACDIDFSEDVIMAESYKINFNGYFEGNAMQIANLRNSYLNSNDEASDLSNMGLFRTLDNAVFKNVTIKADEMFGSACQKVGTVAGTINNSKVYNISLSGEAIVHGKNMAGGLAGYSENSVIKDIHTELSVNAGYRATNTYLYESAVADKVSYAGGVVGVLVGSKVQSVSITNGVTVIGEMVGGGFGLIDKASAVSNAKVYVTDDMFIKGISMIGGLASENRGKIDKSFIQYEDDVQSVIDTGEAVGYFNTIANNDYYRVGITDSNRIDGKATAIGGLVGFNNGGNISNSYSKVNIKDEYALVAGGIVGRSLSGVISNVYASGTIYIKYSDTATYDPGTTISTYYYKYIGGIVGSLANNFIYTQKFDNVYVDDEVNTNVVKLLSATNVLEINNAVSLVSYDYTKLEEYEQTQIGGLVGLVGTINDVAPLKANDNNSLFANSFNKVVYKTATPNIEKANDIATNIVINDVAVLSNNANTQMAVPDGYSKGVNTYGNGYELLQMLSDGKKAVNQTYGTPIYEDWTRNGVKIKGMKTQIFLMHLISNFEFENGDSKTPVLRDIEVTKVDLNKLNIFKKLTSVSYECYLISSVKDLQILSTLINYGYIANGAKGITFMLAGNIDFAGANFAGLGSSMNAFRGTFDGNTYTISNVKFKNNNDIYTGFINYASGMTLKNIAFNGVEFNVSEDDDAIYVGLVGFATNSILSKVSVSKATITVANPNTIAVGAMGGYLFGTTSGASSVQSCYTSVDKININANANVSAFIGATSSQGVNITNCYANILNASIANGVSGKVYGLIAKGTTTTNIINSWTKLYSGTLNSANLLAYDSSVSMKLTKVYKSINSSSDNFNQLSFYQTSSNWSGSTNPWLVTANWNLDNLPASYPTHSWVEKVSIEEPDTNTGFDGIRTHTITKASQLVNIAIQIRNGTIPNGGDGRIFELGTNIDFNNLTTINGNPVQSLGTFEIPFKGIFDGKGYTISNVVLSETAGKDNDISLGFFGRVDSSAIKNVTFNGLTITLNQTAQSEGKTYLGSIAGISTVSTINKVNVKNVTLRISQNENYAYVGGFVGYAEGSKIVNSIFDGAIKANFVGLNKEPIRVGGIVGYVKAQNMHIENNFIRLSNATELEADANTQYGILIGAITKSVSFTQIINNYYQNFSKLIKVCGYGSLDKSNQVGSERNIEEYI